MRLRASLAFLLLATPALAQDFVAGPSTVETATKSVGAAATLIAVNRARTCITIENEGTTDVRIAGTAAGAASGALLPGTKGAAVTLCTSSAIYGATLGSAQTVSVWDIHN